MKRIFYFLVEDVHNAREMKEIEALQSFGRTVVLSAQRPPCLPAGARWVRIAAPSPVTTRLLALWSKLAFFLCGVAPSRTNVEFPTRNLYIRNPAVRWLINALWQTKISTGLNQLLPAFDTLFLLPIRIALRLRGPRVRRAAQTRVSIVMIDALLVRNLPMWASALALRARGSRLIGVIKSWDNPFYTQIFRSPDAFLTWSDAMIEDLRERQPGCSAPCLAWGARPFLPFIEYVESLEEGAACNRPPKAVGTKRFTIGYAAAFSDHVLAQDEIGLLEDIATALRERLPFVSILFRPYPTIDAHFHERLTRHPNIEIMEIAGPAADRFGDGRERIFFGSPQEKVDYLRRCDVFLSMGTSFTIEAAIFGTPIAHFWLAPNTRTNGHQRRLFACIDISDHLERYFQGRLSRSTSIPMLMDTIASAADGDLPPAAGAEALLAGLGARMQDLALDSRAETFLRDLAPSCAG